ncbi:MAG: transposase [Deltaproteobacteria bacterium]|nr:transposase [Deltaproteobacteria bacterium]
MVAKPKRRQFSATYKRRILDEADRCQEPGDIGRLLRREGLYASHLTDWRRAREVGVLQALAPNKRGRKAADPNPLEGKVRELERENAALQESLRKANLIISVQKKVAAMFDEADSNERSS